MKNKCTTRVQDCDRGNMRGGGIELKIGFAARNVPGGLGANVGT